MRQYVGFTTTTVGAVYTPERLYSHMAVYMALDNGFVRTPEAASRNAATPQVVEA